MGSSPESLRTSLEQYESQLAQTEAALVDCTDAMTKLHLYALQEDLLQLISLTKESLSALNPASESSEDNTIQNNINENDDGSACVSDSPSNAQDELANLPGSKCQAPYVYKNGDDIISYHNALVLSIEDRSENTKFEDIMVRVMFVNPTCSEMLPCPFYLEGKCKFDDNKCRYSHGELVHFARLKEFKEPDFTLIKPNALVLAKGTDGIWHRGAIVSVITDDTKCVVKFESVYQPVRTLDIHEVLPLVGGADYAEETADSDTFDSDCGLNVPDRLPEHLVKRDLFTLSPSQQFGAWEQHTKSIGSKLMARMGYVAGTGLGKNATGILQPVSASILPFGKSLDYCMALREASGGDPNLFNVEKLQKQLQEKEANLRQRQHQRYEKRKSQKNVFSFINRAIATDSRSYLENPSTSSGSRNSEISLKDSSERVLNIEKLKVDDDIRKREKDISHLYLTLSKLPKASNLYNYLEKKMIKAQNELRHLQQKESNITKEKSFRETKKQMTTF